MGEQELRAELMNFNLDLLEAEPSSGPAGSSIVPDLNSLTAPGADIPSLREQLNVLVSTGKAKEAIGVQLTHEQVKRLSDKDVDKYIKRYETYVGSKTTESLIDSCIFLVTKGSEWLLTSKTSTLIKKNSETTTSSTKSSPIWPATFL